MIDRGALISAADRLESLAIDLGEQEVNGAVAIDSLIHATNGDIAALRRAHRHCQHRMAELWPGERPVVRAFFYLSAARLQLERTGP